MDKENKRLIGFDLLRIFAMMGIIGLHVMGQGGILQSLPLNYFKSYVILFFYVICFLSVNSFALLSGFLLWKKDKVKHKRIVDILVTTLFYALVITAVFYIFNLYDFRYLGKRIIINSIFPALVNSNWYVTCYTFLFFLIPYLNHFINSIEKDKFKKMLIVLFILMSILPNIFHLTDFFIVHDGYSPIWLIYLYLIGAYIGKYVDIKKIKTSSLLVKITSCIVIAFILNVLVRLITPKIYGSLMWPQWFINYISPFNLIASIYIVMLFYKISIKNISLSKIITFLGISSFSVYIIHTHYLVYEYPLKLAFYDVGQYNFIIIISIIILLMIVIYLICALIEFIRLQLFKIFKINSLVNLIGNKLDKLLK